MIAHLTLAALLSVAPTNEQVLRAVHQNFERVGRATPPEDAALSRAAGQIARDALTVGVANAASLVGVTAAVSTNGGWDPSPKAVVIRSAPDELLLLLEKHELGGEPASLVGVAIEQDQNRAAVAVLIAHRQVDLERFPRTLPRPALDTKRLCGALRAPLTTAELFITRPGGEVDRGEMTNTKGRVCAPLAFPTAGRHTVELLAKGPRGPQVAALFFVDVGDVGDAQAEAVLAEPSSDADARAQLLVRINALRLRMGAGALLPDPLLERVAQAWAERLAAQNFFTHVAPDGSDLKGRLLESGYHFATAGENLSLDRGPLAAHFGIEHSPGHRRNLLEKAHQRLGIGLALRADGLTVLVEVLAQPAAQQEPAVVADPVSAAYQAIAGLRASRKLRALTPHPLLEALAQQHARAALEADTLKPQLAGRPGLHDQVFETVAEAKAVAIDVFIADSPTRIAESKNLTSATNALIGVGIVRGDSAHYGNDKYWIVVVYAAPN